MSDDKVNKDFIENKLIISLINQAYFRNQTQSSAHRYSEKQIPNSSSDANPEINKLWGQYYIESKFVKKIEILAKIQMVNSDPKTYGMMAVTYAEEKDFDEANKQLDKLNDVAPNSFELFYYRGRFSSILENHNDAISNFESALKIKPGDVYALNNKGIALFRLKKYEEAIKCCDDILKIKPDYVGALFSKGIALINLEKYEEAIKCCDEALKIKPDFVGALFSKGRALYNLEKYEEAIKCYEEVLKIKPGDVVVLNNKGIALFRLKKYEEAIKCYDDILRIKPGDVYALWFKGRALSNLEKYEEAIKCYDDILKIKPGDVGALNNKGSALSELGKIPEAIECFEKSLNIEPDKKVEESLAELKQELSHHNDNPSNDNFIEITAKFPGKCLTCKKDIRVGEAIRWSKGIGIKHPKCPD